MTLSRNAICELGNQILASPTWDKSPNRVKSMQHIAREGGLFEINACMPLKIADISDEYEFKNLYQKEEIGLMLVIAQ